MPVAAAISAAGSIGSAALGYFSSKNASEAQTQMGQQSLQQQLQMYNVGLDRQTSMFDRGVGMASDYFGKGVGMAGDYFGKAKDALTPFIQGGASALPTLQGLLTPGNMNSTLESLPGFKFASDWGTRSATNALAAKGLAGSAGPMGKAISDYNNGLAHTYWGQDVGALQALVNSGLGAGNALAGNATSMGNALSGNASALASALFGGSAGAGNAALSASTGTGTNLGATSMGIGNAQAQGILGQSNALSSGLTGASNAFMYPQLLQYIKQLQNNTGGAGAATQGIYAF